MTEVELHHAGGLVAWAEEAKAAHMLATSLVKTSFAGQYKGKPEDATAAIMKGAEIGLTPLAALGSIHLIQGTPALSANALRAVVQAQGHEVWIESSSDKKAVAKARRNGSDVVHTSTWTIDRATALGLTGKQNWRQQAEAMLMARATSEVCRMVASDAILGIAHSVEELDDGPTTDEPRKVARRKTPEPVAAIEPPPGHEATLNAAVDSVREVMDAEVVEERVEQITRPQMQKMQAMFTERGLTDRAARLAYASDVVGRPIATSTDLTKDEARDLIDALEKDK